LSIAWTCLYIESCAGFVRQKRRKRIPSKFRLLLNKRWNPLPPHAMINEPVPVQSEVEELSQYYEEGEQQAHKMTHLVPGGSWT
jgi:hypothetical protein